MAHTATEKMNLVKDFQTDYFTIRRHFDQQYFQKLKVHITERTGTIDGA